MKKLLNEWRSYLAEQEYDLLAGAADKQPLRYVAAGVVVNLINQGHYPKKTQNFSWSHTSEDIEETNQYQLKNSVKVIKDNFSEKHELAIASPQLMKKLAPFIKQGKLRSDMFLKLEKYFSPQTTAQVLKQNAAFSVIDTFLGRRGDIGKYAKLLSEGYPDAFSSIFQTAWGEAKRIKAKAQEGDSQAIDDLLRYIKLGKVSTSAHIRIHEQISSRAAEQTEKDGKVHFRETTDSRFFLYVTTYLVKKA